MEASTENQVGETTTTPLEEGWIEVPSKKSKKNKGQQQAGSPGGKGSGQGGRGGNQGAATLSSADAEQKAKWAAIEEELKPKVVTSNDFDWSLDVALSAKKSPEPQAQGQTPSNTWSKVLFGGVNRQAQSAQKASVSNEPLSLIGGAHVSYYKNNPKKKDFAVASFVVCSFPALEVVYEAVKEMHVDVPFISGFHSFRDSIPLVSLFEELKANKPELVPQIIFVDGPGVLYKGFGLATHLGVLLNIPTVGVTKKFFNVDGLTENQVRKNVSQDLQKRGEAIEIIGRNSGSVLGAAMRTSDSPKGNYAYISIGHRISLSTAVEVVREASIGKVPQPVYAAEHKVKQELQKLDPKPKKPVAPAGGKNAGAGGNRRNAQGGKGGKKEGGRPGGAGKAGGAVGNGKPQDGKQGGGAGQQGKRRGGPKGPRPQGGQGGQGGQPGQGQGPKQGGGAGQPSQGPKQGGGQGGGQGGQGRGRPGGKGPRPQGGGGGQGGGQGGQQGGPQGGQGGKRPGGGRGGNNRPQGGAPKAGNVWTQKAPAAGAAPTSTPSSDGAAAPTPAATTPAAAGQQQRPAGAGNQNKGGQQGGGQAKQGGGQQKKQGGGGGGGGGQQQKKQQPQGEKGGEKQQTAEKKD